MRRGTLAVLCVAQFVDVLGVTIVVVALPALGRTFPAAQTGLQWVVSGYALVFGGVLIAAGRTADRVGHRRTFLGGLVTMAAASAVCAVGPSLVVLVVGRAVQGLAAAFMVPSALAILLVTFPAGVARHRAVGVWTAAGASGGAAGFLVGGLLVDVAGWRAVFVVSLSMCLAALAAVPVVLPPVPPRPARQPLDLPGALLVTLGLLGVLAGCTVVPAAVRLWVLVASVGLLGLFAVVERRARNPLLPAELVRSGRFVAALGVACVLTCTTTPAGVLGTIFLQDRLGHSAATTGLMFAPFSLAVVAGSWLSARFGGRYGHRSTALAGLLVVTSAMAISAVAVSTGSGTVFVLALTVSGLGLGAASVAVTTAGTTAVTDADRGLAAGLLNATPQLGAAVGTAAATGVAQTLTLADAYLFAVALALAGALATLALPRATRTDGRPATTGHRVESPSRP
jgi:MFS family permease